MAAPAMAQQAVSARAGMVNLAQGDVLLDDAPLQLERYQFPQMNDHQVLQTQAGRVEVLLNAGTFLRMGEDSSFRLDKSALTDTRLTFLSGTALIEVDDLLDDNSIHVNFGGKSIELHKNGLYHFEAGDVPRLRVYEGEAWIASTDPDGDPLKIKKGREEIFAPEEVTLAKLEKPEKFDRDETDPLYRWSVRRARVIGRANVSSARLISRSDTLTAPSASLLSSFGGGGFGGMGSMLSPFSGLGWSFNPYYGGFTYVPMNGYAYSPFGVTLFSHQAILMAMRPTTGFMNPSFPNMGFGGGGYIGIGGGGFGGGGMGVGGGMPAAAGGGGAAAAPVRSTGGGGQRR